MLLWWRQKWGPIPPKPGPKSRSTCFERLGKMWVPKKRDLLNRWMIVLGGCFAILCTWLKKENRIVHNCFALLKWSAIFFSKTEGSGVDLLFYALDYSSLQDQDIVLVNPHLNIKMINRYLNENLIEIENEKVVSPAFQRETLMWPCSCTPHCRSLIEWRSNLNMNDKLNWIKVDAKIKYPMSRLDSSIPSDFLFSP